MSAHETIYSVGAAYPDYLVRARAQTVSLPLYRNGALQAPTEVGSTFSLYDAAGNALVSAAGVTVAGSMATYALLAAVLPSTLPLGHGLREEWDVLCADGVRRTYRRDAALVLHAAYPVISDGDLEGVYSDLSSNLASDVTSFQAYIDEAWKRILGRLEQLGVFPEHIVTSWSLREVHIELTLHLVCLDFARAQPSWLELANVHKTSFEAAMGRLKFVKASSSTGTADGTAMRAPRKGVVHMNGAPRATWRGHGGM